jgi:hypothetical protein
MFQAKVVEKIKTHVVLQYLFSENRAVKKIMWKNMVEADRPQMSIRRMRCTCWITKATDRHSEYVTLIALRLQRWLRERDPMLRLLLQCVLCSVPEPNSKCSKTYFI